MLSVHIKKYLPKILGVVFVVVVAVGATLLINNFMEANKHAPKKKVQQITLVKPPPPPPPPPKIERPPEQEINRDEVDIPEPEAMEEIPDIADAPPAGDLLGLDAEGGAGSDGFGLIGRKGGRGLLSGAGDPNVVYASKLQHEIEDILAQVDELRSFAYSVKVDIWVDITGQISKVVLRTSTGRKEMDKKLIATIQQVSYNGNIPDSLQQPIKYRLSSRI